MFLVSFQGSKIKKIFRLMQMTGIMFITLSLVPVFQGSRVQLLAIFEFWNFGTMELWNDLIVFGNIRFINLNNKLQLPV